MPATVLIVDDESLHASFYELALKRKQFTVIRATSVEEGLERVVADRPDVVVVDIMMPPGKLYENAQHFEGLRTGVYLIQDIQRLSPESTIVVATVVKNPETLDMLREMLPAAQVVLKREYDPPKLADLVEKLLASRRAVL